jgi:hypothetical protein
VVHHLVPLEGLAHERDHAIELARKPRIHAGHEHVDKNHVRSGRRAQALKRRANVSDARCFQTFVSETLRQRVARVAVVVYDEYAPRHNATLSAPSAHPPPSTIRTGTHVRQHGVLAFVLGGRPVSFRGGFSRSSPPSLS